MAERKCRFCLYWHSRLPGRVQPRDDSVGECRFNPPTVSPSISVQRSLDKRGVWPETYGGDWCGQFSLHRWPQPGGGFLKAPPAN